MYQLVTQKKKKKTTFFFIQGSRNEEHISDHRDLVMLSRGVFFLLSRLVFVLMCSFP